MADTPSSESKKNQSTEPPAPEDLKPKADDSSEAPAEEATKPAAASSADKVKVSKRLRRGTYRPSHKATFIGLAVVVAILAINVGIISFVLKNQSKSGDQLSKDQVTISQSDLNKLGVNSTPVGDSGIQLTIGPSTKFNSNVQVAGNVSIAGQLLINSKFSASDASLTQLQAGNTSLSSLNVNGNATVSNLNLRSNLVVAGTTRLTGTTTTGSLAVNNNLNVSGSLAVGGTLAVGSFETGNLTVGGHVITAGSAPGVSRGSCVGSNGTVSISGNDAAGTVAVNIGAGGCGGGVVANVTFRNPYSNIPHVVLTPVGQGVIFYVNRSTSGFSIGVDSASAGGYAFDYIVEQ